MIALQPSNRQKNLVLDSMKWPEKIVRYFTEAGFIPSSENVQEMFKSWDKMSY